MSNTQRQVWWADTGQVCRRTCLKWNIATTSKVMEKQKTKSDAVTARLIQLQISNPKQWEGHWWLKDKFIKRGTDFLLAQRTKVPDTFLFMATLFEDPTYNGSFPWFNTFASLLTTLCLCSSFLWSWDMNLNSQNDWLLKHYSLDTVGINRALYPQRTTCTVLKDM